MKSLQLSLLALTFTGLFMASCKKETKVVPPNQNTTGLNARTLKVYDANGTNSATLRFQSSSKELLDHIALDQFDFTLVQTPTPGNSVNLSTTSLGNLDFSEKNVNREPADVNALQQSDQVVYVDIIPDSRNQPVSIEVKSKVADNSSDIVGNATQTLWPAGVQVFFHG